MNIGVIDIGSNTIKLLIAEVGAKIRVLEQSTQETRISSGIGNKKEMTLDNTSMSTGLDAIKELIEISKIYAIDELIIVATSAVRDANNQSTFIDLVKKQTGHTIRVLSGEEEAHYIAQGILSDHSLNNHDEFSIIDLGGGSLECIHVKNRNIKTKVSLPLGAVRLSERFIRDCAQPIAEHEANLLVKHVQNTLQQSEFKFPLNRSPLVGTGGGLNVTRAIKADLSGQDYEAVDPFISLDFIKNLYREIACVGIHARKKIKALPPTRADILPVALLILSTFALEAQANGFIHSMQNLRFGIASEFLTKKR